MYTPVNPNFTVWKWGLRGSKLYRYVFVMDVCTATDQIEKCWDCARNKTKLILENNFGCLHDNGTYCMNNDEMLILTTKTYLYNFDPLKPHFYIVKLGFTGVCIIFLISAKNIDCGYSLEPPHRGCSNEYPQSMFWAEIWKKYQIFLSENFMFLEVKFSIYLNRRVFVMLYWKTNFGCLHENGTYFMNNDEMLILLKRIVIYTYLCLNGKRLLCFFFLSLFLFQLHVDIVSFSYANTTCI